MSVVLAARNAASTIPAQLDALSKQTYGGPSEVIVVDNASEDGTGSIARQWTDRIRGLRVVDARDGRTAGYARNAGAREAAGDVILCCDADDVVAPDWLAAMVRCAASFDIFGGRHDVESLDNPLGIDPAFNVDGLQRPIGYLPHVGGACLGVWADVLQAIGGWNEARGGDDIDLCWRAQLASYRIGFAPDAVVHFRLRQSLRALMRQNYRDGQKWPRLYRDFRDKGMPRSSAAQALAAWAWLLVTAPTLIWNVRRRTLWARRAGQRAGRVVASIRHRTRFL